MNVCDKSLKKCPNNIKKNVPLISATFVLVGISACLCYL